jgi:hypothetical protein
MNGWRVTTILFVTRPVNAVVYTIRRLRMRLIAAMQQIIVTTTIHTRCSSMTGEIVASVNILIIATRWVSGSRVSAMYWRAAGMSVSGKNVPEKSAMGVMKRNAG